MGSLLPQTNKDSDMRGIKAGTNAYAIASLKRYCAGTKDN